GDRPAGGSADGRGARRPNRSREGARRGRTRVGPVLSGRMGAEAGAAGAAAHDRRAGAAVSVKTLLIFFVGSSCFRGCILCERGRFFRDLVGEEIATCLT